MKKIALLCVSLLFISVLSTNTFAQLKFGAKAGLNIATINGDDADAMDSKTGLVLGGFMTYQFSHMFAVQPEILYSMKGAKADGNGSKVTFSLNYIEIPVLVKFLIPIEGDSKIYPALYAGPSIAFNVSSEYEIEQNGNSQTNNLDDETSSIDFGLAFGGSIAFPVTPNNQLGADFRYTFGLTSVDDSGTDLDLKNGVFSITAFFTF